MEPEVVVEVTGAAGVLDAWVDFDLDGIWEDSEKIFDSLSLPVGIHRMRFPVPSEAPENEDSYARFRISTAGGLDPTGIADDGEVEDYKVRLGERVSGVAVEVPDSGDGDEVMVCIPLETDFVIQQSLNLVDWIDVATTPMGGRSCGELMLPDGIGFFRLIIRSGP